MKKQVQPTLETLLAQHVVKHVTKSIEDIIHNLFWEYNDSSDSPLWRALNAAVVKMIPDLFEQNKDLILSYMQQQLKKPSMVPAIMDEIVVSMAEKRKKQ